MATGRCRFDLPPNFRTADVLAFHGRDRQAIGTTGVPDAKAVQTWLMPFAPWRALVAAHLWASLALSA